MSPVAAVLQAWNHAAPALTPYLTRPPTPGSAALGPGLTCGEPVMAVLGSGERVQARLSTPDQ